MLHLIHLFSFVFGDCFQKYVENVKQDASIGTNILRVSASDEDADNNGAIVYTLSAPYNPLDLEYFEIQPDSGWIVLKKPLDVSFSLTQLILFQFLYTNDKSHFFSNYSLVIWKQYIFVRIICIVNLLFVIGHI